MPDSSASAEAAEMEMLMEGLGAFIPAMEEVKDKSAKIRAGSATADDVADLKSAAAAAKCAKAVLSTASPDTLRELKETATARETKRIVALMRQSQEVDLCFVLDATGSMGGVIDAVKSNIRGIVQHLGKCCPHLKLRLALVGYRDLEDGADHFAVTDFAPSVDVFEAALASLKAGGGGDQCEDVIGGLDQATRLGWSQTTKVLMLCADAPCHGTQYHDGCGDHHPGGTGMEAHPVLQQLQQLGADCTFMRMNGTTEKMVAKFNEEAGGALFSTSPLDTADLERSTIDIIKESLGSSLSKSAASAKAKRRVFEPALDAIIEAKEKGSASSAGGGSAVSADRLAPPSHADSSVPWSEATAGGSAKSMTPSAAAMTLPEWFDRLQRDGAAEVMERIGVEQPLDLLEIEADEIEEIVAVLPRLKARQFQRFVESSSASAA